MEASDLNEHISRRYNKDIEDLRNTVLAMGGLVESQLSQAIAAIVSGDSELGLAIASSGCKSQEMTTRSIISRSISTKSAAGFSRLVRPLPVICD